MAKDVYRIPQGTFGQIALLLKASGGKVAGDLLMAIERYAGDGTEPSGLDDYARIVFESVRESIDISRKRSDSGRAGGKQTASKTEANYKQNASKTEANLKQEEKDEEDREKREERSKEENKEREEEEREDITASVDITSVISPSAVCAEPEDSDFALPPPLPSDPPLITIPLNTGEEYPIDQDIFDTLAQLYPAVDTMQTLRDIKGWCLGNPSRRKTKRGISRFLHSWFSKEQDKGPRSSPISDTRRRLTPTEVAALPMIDVFGQPGTNP